MQIFEECRSTRRALHANEELGIFIGEICSMARGWLAGGVVFSTRVWTADRQVAAASTFLDRNLLILLLVQLYSSQISFKMVT